MKLSKVNLHKFVAESNSIEGIFRVLESEVEATRYFLNLSNITVEDIQTLARSYQFDAALRTEPYMNVRVGNHIAPQGGPGIAIQLQAILDDAMALRMPYYVHLAYENLHPFTDGNGRTGRALWLWQMVKLDRYKPQLGFLHTWYYQSLAYAEKS